MLLNLDRSFKVELTWLQNGAYETLATKLDEAVLACFPKDGVPITTQQCETKLQQIKEGLMYKCASRQSQSVVDTMRGVLAKMAQGFSPAESIKTGGGVYSQIWSSLPLFVRYKSRTTEEELSGAAALKAKFDDLVQMLSAENRNAQLHELDQFKAIKPCSCNHFFYFLLLVLL